MFSIICCTGTKLQKSMLANIKQLMIKHARYNVLQSALSFHTPPLIPLPSMFLHCLKL